MELIENNLNGASEPPLISLRAFCSATGVSRQAAWRWRKLGWLETLDINGKPYVSAEEIRRFKARAAAGEFAKQPKAPNRTATATN